MNHLVAGAVVDFDLDGPRIGSLRLLRRQPIGFAPPASGDLTEMFSTASLDIDRLQRSLRFIADAMNKGDVALAAVATSRLRLPKPERRHDDIVAKASSEDPKHPGYPAGTPDHKGGQFRPKEDGSGLGLKEKAERLRRLAERKTFRSIARRILSVKRVLRTIALFVDSLAVDEVPIVNDVVGSAEMENEIELLADFQLDKAETDAAIEFVNKGPFDLKELQRSPEQPQSFSSFDAFRKIELEKRFGPAGDGYEYHHIVEQGPNARLFTQEQLQSTENIIRIPRLLHEEVTSVYGTAVSGGRGSITPRELLRGRSFKEQYDYGLTQLRQIGIIH